MSWHDELAEAEIHTELEPYRVRGEWFDLTETQVQSVITVLSDKFRHRPIWNQCLQPYPPADYVEPYRPRPLLTYAA